MTRSQGAMICALLAFLCIHVLAADVVGLYLYSQIGNDSNPTVIMDQSSPLCDPEGDVCP
jgi:hypothetical protein